MANYVVGLTGGIGSGKTAASDYFASLGIDIVDADVVARQVVAPGTSALKAIAEHFGEHLIQHDGTLDRKALRQIVFDNEQHKRWLNQLLHPLIRRQLLNQLQQATSTYVVLVAPLLLENELDQFCQRVLVIDVPEALQIERTVARDQSSSQQVEAIMAAQIPRQQRLQRADDIVSNHGDLNDLQQQLLSLHRHYLREAKAQSQR